MKIKLLNTDEPLKSKKAIIKARNTFIIAYIFQLLFYILALAGTLAAAVLWLLYKKITLAAGVSLFVIAAILAIGGILLNIFLVKNQSLHYFAYMSAKTSRSIYFLYYRLINTKVSRVNDTKFQILEIEYAKNSKILTD
ncbi:hypothetical protein [Metamycoplasma neophronis]|uniref:Uncharacterized protein n=1 Tax=Metamycoplasma neophronis TaxID=872983 RepID=A0ABY2Z0U2_9BACT|nr:hypothetical protein [Metamycoplasma neophronis]TPR53911.1 hypothetical protein FJR74_02000 [Metamycoplasma neophronis]